MMVGDQFMDEIIDSMEDRHDDEIGKFKVCIICGEKYDIDEGCCLIDS